MSSVSPSKDIIIRTTGLGRDFGRIRAVDDLTFEVPSGTIFGFLGPNGAGKTTTIRLLLGLLEPSRGAAEVLGFNSMIQGDEVRLRCGVLLEYSGLYERLSAEDNLEFFGRIWRLPSPERRARTKELLSHFGLWERKKEITKAWSRGMKQKLALARALLHRPQLVFLDEPTAGLDPVAAASLRDDLASLASKEGVTIFMNTHNLMEAEKLCGLVGVIRNGTLLTIGPPDELRRRRGTPHAEIVGRHFGDKLLAELRAQPDVLTAEIADDTLSIELRREIDIAPLISLIVNSGGAIEEVRKGRASLEDVFLTLMEEKR